jgi:RimJ/RimL family protein N-acetyltransferase
MNELLQPLQPESSEHQKVLLEFLGNRIPLEILENRIPYENFYFFSPSILAKYADAPLPWQRWAQQISEAIDCAIQKGSHMFSVRPEEIITSISEGEAAFALATNKTNNQIPDVAAFVRAHRWLKDKKIVGTEVSGLIVPELYRGNSFSQVAIRLLVEEMKKKFPGVPIFAVVAKNNIPSLKTFRNLGCREEHAEGEYFIGSGDESGDEEKVNILEEWPHPSSIFFF